MNIHRWRSHTRARTKDQRNAASQPRPTINSITPTCTAPLGARAGRLRVPACQHLPLYRRLRRASISAFILSLSSNNSRSRYVAVSAVGLKGAWGAGRGTPPVGPPGAPCDGLYGRCVIFALSCRYEEARRVGIDGRCEAIQGSRTVSMIVMARRQARGATRLCGEAGSNDPKRAGRVARCAVGGTRLTDHGSSSRSACMHKPKLSLSGRLDRWSLARYLPGRRGQELVHVRSGHNGPAVSWNLSRLVRHKTGTAAWAQLPRITCLSERLREKCS